jgi:hypothetical protein
MWSIVLAHGSLIISKERPLVRPALGPWIVIVSGVVAVLGTGLLLGEAASHVMPSKRLTTMVYGLSWVWVAMLAITLCSIIANGVSGLSAAFGDT